MTDTEKLRELWLQGKTMAEIGAAFGRPLQWASVQCHKIGLPLRRPGSRVVNGSEAADLYKSGWTIRQLQDRYKVSASTILTVLKQRKVPTRKGIVIGSQRTSKITRLFRAGYMGVEIADLLKLSPDIVWKTLRRVMGVQKKGGRRRRRFLKEQLV